MNIQEAKQEIIHTLQAYLRKDDAGNYLFPAVHQRPILLMGPPGIGKTAIMEQVARRCGVGPILRKRPTAGRSCLSRNIP